MLSIGTKAPLFTLPDQNNNMVSLSDFFGKKIVLYFYPKDNTPGCTKQALEYKELYDEFVDLDTVVLGISKDSVASHFKFSTKYELPFKILSDSLLEVVNLYDVYKEKKLYGKTYMGVVRTTYLINENGIIIRANENVKPDQDASNMVCELNIGG